PISDCRAHNLSAKRAVGSRRNAATWTGTALDECAGVRVRVIDVRLVSTRLPFRARIAGNFAELHRAKLNAAVGSGAFEFQLSLELEVFRFAAFPEQVRRTRRRIGLRTDDDRPVFDVPQIGRAVPAFERGAVEHPNPSGV